MATMCLIRKAASLRVVQGAVLSPRRIFFPLVINTPERGRAGAGAFSTVSKAPKFEIKSGSYIDIQLPKPPLGFPFIIEDIPGEDFIILKRDYAGEKIIVEVTNPIEDDTYTYTNLNVKVSKPNGGRLLDLHFTADCYNSIKTEIVLFEDPGKGIRSKTVTFGQKALWREFIRVRGIEDSICQFLIEYMMKRKERDYLLFLKKFRKFVE